jgi:hypothetical protein
VYCRQTISKGGGPGPGGGVLYRGFFETSEGDYCVRRRHRWGRRRTAQVRADERSRRAPSRVPRRPWLAGRQPPRSPSGVSTGPPMRDAFSPARAASSTIPPTRMAYSGVRWNTSTPWFARRPAGVPAPAAARMSATAWSEPRGRRRLPARRSPGRASLGPLSSIRWGDGPPRRRTQAHVPVSVGRDRPAGDDPVGDINHLCDEVLIHNSSPSGSIQCVRPPPRVVRPRLAAAERPTTWPTWTAVRGRYLDSCRCIWVMQCATEPVASAQPVNARSRADGPITLGHP